MYNYFRLPLIWILISAGSVIWFFWSNITLHIWNFDESQKPQFFIIYWVLQNSVARFTDHIIINLRICLLPFQLTNTQWSQIPLWQSCPYLTGMLLPNFHVPLFLWQFLHPKSLVLFNLWIPTIWLCSKGHKTSILNMTGWIIIVIVCTISSWVVVVFWGLLRHITCKFIFFTLLWYVL